MKFIVTGSAGFIGYHLSKKLLNSGHAVIGVDNFNSYYDVELKKSRSFALKKFHNYSEFKGEGSQVIAKEDFKDQVEDVDLVIHLAAQAGVRYSLTNPDVYIESNIVFFHEILKLCRHFDKKLIYASSSSVYGEHKNEFSGENDISDKPTSIYGATKKTNELLAETYYSGFKVKSAGLRFFTVYGEYGRPDMAYWSFTEKINNSEAIDVYGDGLLLRDFTYIDDIVQGIINCINKHTFDNHTIFNLGNNETRSVNELVDIIERNLHKKAVINFKPKDNFDVFKTSADILKAKKILSFKPNTSLEDGMFKFVKWYLDYVKK